MDPSYRGKQVVILGLARQGTALARAFCALGACVTVSDMATAQALEPFLKELDGLDVTLVLGGHPLSLLDGCHLLCLSGGVPPQLPVVQEARRLGIPLSNDAILTLEHSPAPVAGITGSSGKTTTTTLVGLMLAASGLTRPVVMDSQALRSGPGPHVWIGGNIGTPLVDRLDQVRPHDWLVLELSSFQLELFDDASGGRSMSPQVAAVLNVTPNHLDRHPSMAHYAACKANVLRWQSPRATAILGADDAVTGRWLRSGLVDLDAGAGQEAVRFPLRGARLGFGLGAAVGEGCWLQDGVIILRVAGREHSVLETSQVQLRGRHNLLNIMAACAIAAAGGATPAAMAEVAGTFAGVAHRLELVRILDDVRWINDSIATTPERAVAALHSFQEPIVLLAGGRDKKLPWEEFARLAHRRARALILFGEAADLIREAVDTSEMQSGLQIVRCTDLAEAVDAAARLAQPGDVVLLSPGGTSFDAYRDFEARGQHYRDLVNALAMRKA